MKRLTQEERRRMFLAQQMANQAMLDRLAQPIAVVGEDSQSARRHRLLKTVMIATLLGTGILAFHLIEFHLPTSIEALLPRL